MRRLSVSVCLSVCHAADLQCQADDTHASNRRPATNDRKPMRRTVTCCISCALQCTWHVEVFRNKLHADRRVMLLFSRWRCLVIGTVNFCEEELDLSEVTTRAQFYTDAIRYGRLSQNEPDIRLHAQTAAIERRRSRTLRRHWLWQLFHWISLGNRFSLHSLTFCLLGYEQNYFNAAQSSKFPTKSILGYSPHLTYVAALPWKTK